MINIGWATGGGAAQILFSVFGEIVFNRGPAGLGMVWGCAGIGLLCGGALAYTHRPAAQLRATTNARSSSATSCTAASYILFSQSRNFSVALVFIALSRAGVGVSSVLNMSQLLRIVPDGFAGRVFSTMESMPVVGDDALDDGRRNRVAILRPAHHRRDRRRAQLHDRDILGLGPLDRPPARAGARRVSIPTKWRCTDEPQSA